MGFKVIIRYIFTIMRSKSQLWDTRRRLYFAVCPILNYIWCFFPKQVAIHSHSTEKKSNKIINWKKSQETFPDSCKCDCQILIIHTALQCHYNRYVPCFSAVSFLYSRGNASWQLKMWLSDSCSLSSTWKESQTFYKFIRYCGDEFDEQHETNSSVSFLSCESLGGGKVALSVKWEIPLSLDEV